ncbi:hypothetical protein JS562_54115, partial [Agrobacterium sp. S2]|nr:hypothetical protein [Agrobacterium sp. S2]
AGLRYRVNARPECDLRRTADLLFTRARVVVLIDGCYWHGCPEHFKMPSTNRDYWEGKIGRNRLRDVETTELLEEAGLARAAVLGTRSPRLYRSEHRGCRARSASGHSLTADRLSAQSLVIVCIGARRSGKSLYRAMSEVSP